MQPTLKEVLLVIIERYHADRKAMDGYVDDRARRLTQSALDSFMSNVATELQERYGLSLEGFGD